ncbi:MAG TPA: hypothetical protein VFT22_36910 [Kofleriaceae bacterium]|nr:hypothetical protein [Kofleriaceae bacterium]
MTFSVLFASALAMASYQDPHFTMNAPKGWSVTVDWDHGAVMIQKAPADPRNNVTIQLSGHLGGNAMTEPKMLSVLQSQFRSLNTTDLSATSLVTTAEISGTIFRVAASFRIEPGFTLVGVLLSSPDAFDAAGGLDTVREVVASVKLKDEPPRPAFSSRPDKRILAPEVASRRPGGLSPSELVGAWSFVRGGQHKVVESSNGRTERYRLDGSGFSLSYTFAKNGTYELLAVTQVASAGLITRGEVDERGQWSLDGATLTLKPSRAHAMYQTGKQKKDYGTTQPAPRTLGLWTAQVQDIAEAAKSSTPATNDAIVLEGPCSPRVTEADCRIQDYNHGFILQREK